MDVTKNENLLLPQTKLNYMITELQKGLLNDLFWLLKESNNHDAIINIGEAPNVKSFKAHTSILSARSLYFRAILSSDHSTKRNSLIEITQTNIRPDVFEVILKFLYTGKISFKNEKNAKSLFEYIIAAEKLWLYQLIQYIENFMIYQMSDWLKSNFVYVLIKTTTNPSSFRLLHEFVNDMLRNHPYLLFDSDDFDAIPENILVQLLQHRKFKDIPEEKIWNTVLNWGIYQHVDLIDKYVRDWTPSDFSKLQTSLQRTVPLIRFTNIPPKIFYDLIEPYKEILTTGLYQKIVQTPMFVTYNRLVLRYPHSQRRDSFSSTSIPSPILHAFPMPPSKGIPPSKDIPPPKDMPKAMSSSKDMPFSKDMPPSKDMPSSKESSIILSLTSSEIQCLSQSTVDSTPETTESPISNSTKPKNMLKRNGSIKKTDELLAKITSSVLSSTYTVRRKPKASSMTIENSEKCILTGEKLKRSNTTTKKSEFSNLESIIELKSLKSFGPEIDTSSLPLRKMKRLLNRKTSIVSNSTSSSTMSISTLSR